MIEKGTYAYPFLSHFRLVLVHGAFYPTDPKGRVHVIMEKDQVGGTREAGRIEAQYLASAH